MFSLPFSCCCVAFLPVYHTCPIGVLSFLLSRFLYTILLFHFITSWRRIGGLTAIVSESYCLPLPLSVSSDHSDTYSRSWNPLWTILPLTRTRYWVVNEIQIWNLCYIKKTSFSMCTHFTPIKLNNMRFSQPSYILFFFHQRDLRSLPPPFVLSVSPLRFVPN